MASKAFMSTGANRDDARGMFPPHAVAYAEARAILAVSEPGIWIGGPGAACGWAQRDITSKGGPSPVVELAILAESLAAFVGSSL